MAWFQAPSQPLDEAYLPGRIYFLLYQQTFGSVNGQDLQLTPKKENFSSTTNTPPHTDLACAFTDGWVGAWHGSTIRPFSVEPLYYLLLVLYFLRHHSHADVICIEVLILVFQNVLN